jgi:hypothetical protein
VYLLWNSDENFVEAERPEIKIWRMRIACWIPKSTNTRSEYVIVTAFPVQQCLPERAPIFRHTYVVCLVVLSVGTSAFRVLRPTLPLVF